MDYSEISSMWGYAKKMMAPQAFQLLEAAILLGGEHAPKLLEQAKELDQAERRNQEKYAAEEDREQLQDPKLMDEAVSYAKQASAGDLIVWQRLLKGLNP